MEFPSDYSLESGIVCKVLIFQEVLPLLSLNIQVRDYTAAMIRWTRVFCFSKDSPSVWSAVALSCHIKLPEKNKERAHFEL